MTTELSTFVNYKLGHHPEGLKLVEGKWYDTYTGIGYRKAQIVKLRMINEVVTVYYRVLYKSSFLGLSRKYNFYVCPLEEFQRAVIDFGKISSVDLTIRSSSNNK